MSQNTITSIEDIVRIGKKFKHNWYRGHPNECNTLTPRVFRDEFSSSLHKASSSNLEFELTNNFKRIAPSLSSNLPIANEDLKWLILMQHYGVPTRLLDWTESILVAAFFCVSNALKEDGEIWRLYPQTLNKFSINYEGFPLEESSFLKYLAQEPMHLQASQLASDLNLDEPIKNPIAFFPTLSFQRMTSQLSTFTIHSNPIEGNAITELLVNNLNSLNRYIIPKNKKQEILTDLISLGINFRTLFNDLDHFSSDLVRQYKNPFWNVWGQPSDD